MIKLQAEHISRHETLEAIQDEGKITKQTAHDTPTAMVSSLQGFVVEEIQSPLVEFSDDCVSTNQAIVDPTW